MTTLTTPYPDMYRTIWQEFEKCEYWVQKQLHARGDAILKDVLDIKKNNKLFGENKPFPYIEYKAKSGNRWINYLYDGHIGIKYDSVCYWETYGSFGAFILCRIDGTPTIIITPSHFWQRVCERTDYKMNGVHTAMSFLDDNRAYLHEQLPPDEGDTRKKIAIHWNGGSGYGVEVSEEYHIFEVRTFIPENSMSGHKLKERKKITEDLLSEDTYRAYEQWNDLATISGDSTDRFALLDQLNPKSAEDIDGDLRKKGQKLMEDTLAMYKAQGMTEEEAIKAYVGDSPATYYVSKYGEHKTTYDPKICELNARLRMSELERFTNQDWQELLIESENLAGGKIPQNTKKVLKYIFNNGYEWGWSATVNWSTQELPEEENATPFQEYKHGVYEHYMKIVRGRKTNIIKEVDNSVFDSFATFGFDLAVIRSSIILANTLGIKHEKEPTVREYIEKHVVNR